jgi:hypothetical protein
VRAFSLQKRQAKGYKGGDRQAEQTDDPSTSQRTGSDGKVKDWGTLLWFSVVYCVVLCCVVMC